MRSQKQDMFTEEDLKGLLSKTPEIIRKAFGMVFEKQKEIREKSRLLREEIKHGTRKGKAESIIGL